MMSPSQTVSKCVNQANRNGGAQATDSSDIAGGGVVEGADRTDSPDYTAGRKTGVLNGK
jgi:hypothetical protein